ncbi:MAG TPA: VOC family protein [Polyangia bacterium]
MTERVPIPGKFVWFELVTRDPRTKERAQAFYGEVLGWKTTPFPMGSGSYDMIFLGDSMIGGYAPDANCPRAHWTSYISVADVDGAVKTALANGGTIVTPAADVPQAGRRAQIADPQGAVLGLFKHVRGDEPDHEPPPGGWLWCELHTPDPPQALTFYSKVVGFQHRTMDMGPAGAYHILSQSDRDRGGVTPHLPPGVPPHWLPYVFVTDTDATMARVQKLGGKILMALETVPGVGRMGVFEDPTGAALAMLTPAPSEKKR